MMKDSIFSFLAASSLLGSVPMTEGKNLKRNYTRDFYSTLTRRERQKRQRKNRMANRSRSINRK